MVREHVANARCRAQEKFPNCTVNIQSHSYMARETERKFLLLNDSWRVESDSGSRIMQGYLANKPDCTVRVRADKTWLTVKGGATGADGMSRLEYEYPIPLADADAMLAERPFIEKVRHEIKHAKHVWEIDEFSGENAGLVVAEVELAQADETYAAPSWLGEEVSNDSRYLDAALVKRPFSTW